MNSRAGRERPILFSAPMVRAILSGQKTQTRRALTPQPGNHWAPDTSPVLGRITSAHPKKGRFGVFIRRGIGTDFPESDLIASPYGQPGDRLWVREAHSIYPTHGQHRAAGERWGPWGGLPTTVSEDGKQIAYYREGFDRCDPGRWRPSIHMPRWASRITLEITGVRVERLHDITHEDALAEGVVDCASLCAQVGAESRNVICESTDETARRLRWPQRNFELLWKQISGQSSWDANPWVWVIEFKRAQGLATPTDSKKQVTE